MRRGEDDWQFARSYEYGITALGMGGGDCEKGCEQQADHGRDLEGQMGGNDKKTPRVARRFRTFSSRSFLLGSGNTDQFDDALVLFVAPGVERGAVAADDFKAEVL